MSRLKIGLFFLLTFCISTVSFGQQGMPQGKVDVDKVSDDQLKKYLAEKESRGMSDAEMEKSMLLQGYTKEDIAKIRERIARIKAGAVGKTKTDSPAAKEREQLDQLSERTADKVSNTKSDTLSSKEIFGSAFFRNANISFEPNLRLATPADYILGPGDELSVDISGYAYQHYDLKVSPEGTVRMENLAPIYVSGLTIKQAKEKIVERLKTLFGGLRNGSLTADVTLGNIRSIKVTIIGEALRPGTYTVSSLATAFNALYACGGPSSIGSLRNIKIFRGNKQIQTIDAYDFIMSGSQRDNIRLQDQDVILIPVIEKTVEVKGAVRRPGIFELKADDTFADVLPYAGGFNDVAYTNSVSVERSTGKEKVLLTFNASEQKTFLTKDGDVFEVGTILDRFANKVNISGAVFRPGDYALGKDVTSLKDLIKIAEGLREDAFLNRGILIREQENKDPIYLPVDIRELMSGKIADIPLQRQDKFVVKSIVELREGRSIEISGAVNAPGQFDYVDGMTVKDVILLSGGFTEGAAEKRIEIARRIKTDNANDEAVEVISHSIDKDLSTTTASVQLMPFDKVYVRSLANYEIQREVTVEGEVAYAGIYAISSRSERIADIIKRAGGIKKDAYLPGAQLYRDGQLIAVDIDKGLKNPSSVQNMLLEAGDKIIIPKSKETVSIRGQVLNPTEVAFQPNFNFQDYIAQAGGFTDSAHVSKTYVKYANGLTDRTRSFLGMRIYPTVERGMTVFVPERNRVKLTPPERIAIGTGLVSVSAVLLTIIRLFQ